MARSDPESFRGWRAFDGQDVNIGMFDTEQEAATAFADGPNAPPAIY